MTIEQELQAVGHARVIAVLKPTKRRKGEKGLSFALDETISLQQDAVRTIERCFKPFRNSRTAQLTKEIAATSSPTVRSKSAPELVNEKPKAAYAPRDPHAEPGMENSGMRYFPYLGIVMGTVDRQGIDQLRQHQKEVAALFSPPEMSLIRPFEDDLAALAGPEPGNSWALERLKIPALWDAGLTGQDVLIGHLDTGIDSAHPALAQQVNAYAVFDETGQRLVTPATLVDTAFHGTHTAGLLVGKPFQGVTFGVAPAAQLVSGTVIEEGDVPARVVAGLDWLIGQGVSIVSLSLGVRAFDALVDALMKQLRQRDVLPVVAIGNEGPTTSRSPGNLKESLSVGAIDDADEIWFNSSSQQMAETPKRIVPVMIAPGAGVWSSAPNGTMKKLSGTSMATPHIAGLAALLKQHRPDASAAAIEKAIIASCKRPPGISTLRGNKGVPDAVVAMQNL